MYELENGFHEFSDPAFYDETPVSHDEFTFDPAKLQKLPEQALESTLVPVQVGLESYYELYAYCEGPLDDNAEDEIIYL